MTKLSDKKIRASLATLLKSSAQLVETAKKRFAKTEGSEETPSTIKEACSATSITLDKAKKINLDSLDPNNEQNVKPFEELALKTKTLAREVKADKELSSRFSKASHEFTRFVKLLKAMINLGNTQLTEDGKRQKLGFVANVKRRWTNLGKSFDSKGRG